MGMDRDHGDIVFGCDTCLATFATDQADFGSALNFAKRNGWKPYKLPGDTEWSHACDVCSRNWKARPK